MSQDALEITPRNSGAWMIGLLVSLGALAVAFWGARPERLVGALRSAQFVYLIPAVGMLLMGLIARARSWQILLGDGVPLTRAFWALNAGYLLNNALPFRLGEMGRAYLISRGREGRAGSASRALSSVVVERLIDVVVSLTGLIVVLPFALSAAWAPRVAWVSGGLALALFSGLYLAARNRPAVVRLVEAVLARFPGKRLSRLSNMADSFLMGLDVLRDPRRLAGAGFWSAIAWLTAWAQIWCAQRAFGISSWITALFVLGVVAFGAAVPSSPGAIGVYELAATAALLAFDVPRETALSVAILSHIALLGVTSLLGAIALAREGQSVSKLAASAQRLFVRTAEEFS